MPMRMTGPMGLRPDRICTVAPAQADTAHPVKPEFIRLPKPGQQCPCTGLTRSYLNYLILPNEDNRHAPPVKSVYRVYDVDAVPGIRVPGNVVQDAGGWGMTTSGWFVSPDES